jgi:hypothetical protein
MSQSLRKLTLLTQMRLSIIVSFATCKVSLATSDGALSGWLKTRHKACRNGEVDMQMHTEAVSLVISVLIYLLSLTTTPSLQARLNFSNVGQNISYDANPAPRYLRSTIVSQY